MSCPPGYREAMERKSFLIIIKPERFKSSIYLEKFKRIEKNEMQGQKEMKGKVSTPTE